MNIVVLQQRSVMYVAIHMIECMSFVLIIHFISVGFAWVDTYLTHISCSTTWCNEILKCVLRKVVTSQTVQYLNSSV